MSYGNARTMRRRAVLSGTALVALGLALAPAPSRAADWTGANSTDWFDPGNWSGGVPTNATGAVINTVTPNETLIDGAAAEALAMNVGQTGNGALTIQNGGSLSSGQDTNFGYFAGATGAVTVNGVGSSWTNGIGLFIGVNGIGTLTIENGGVVNSAVETRLGFNFSGSGTATVDGAGSSFTTGSLAVGDSGTGTLTIRNGGTVSTDSSFLGNGLGSSGAVTVDGTGSSWSTVGVVQVGLSGTGTLTIGNGGTVTSGLGNIGGDTNSTGTATVDGTGSSWSTTGSLFVGSSGTGTLTIRNGGAMSNTTGYVGSDPGSTGTVTVDGTGSSWTNGSDLYVGNSGTGTLTIQNGGTVSNAAGFIGYFSGSTGTVTIDGVGSSWTNTGALYVGNSGAGTLTIQNGGLVSGTDAYLGRFANSTGTVTVDGAGSSWTSTFLNVGYAGTGTLTIQNGGTVSNTAGYVGTDSGSIGAVTVDGAGSFWTNTGALFIGNSGDGTLAIQNGGVVNSTVSNIGNNSGSTGMVTVDGAGSSWTSSVVLYVGNSGTGTMTIQNGGAVSSDVGHIGRFASSLGTVTVDGTNSSWNNNGLYVGSIGGTGILTIQNGGRASTNNGWIGFSSTSTGSVTVDGAGSTVTAAANLRVGEAGDGTLTIRNGGTVSAPSVVIANLGTSSGTLNIGAASGQAAVAPGSLNTASVAFGAGNGRIVFNHTAANYAFNPVISGAGSVTVEAGTTVLTGTNTYTGATTVNGGTLAVNGSILNSSGVTVNSGGALGGTGTVSDTTIGSGGALAPGNSIGTLTVQGNLTFNAGGVYRVEVSPTASDRTNVTGTATLSGATVQAVALPGSFRAQTYTILNATGGFGGTQFAGLTGSTFAPGARNPRLTYDLNNVYLVLDAGTLDLPVGTGGNQSSAAGAINNAVLNGATPPAAFDALHNMTDGQLSNALGQLSGQPGASTSQTGIAATGQFAAAVIDGAFGDGGGSGQGGALGYAQAPARTREATEAYAAVTPHDRRTPSFEQRWNVWASVYGGNSRVGGDASAGTTTTTSKIYGTAVGASYRFTRDTQAGFALGGAGSSFGLDDGLGGGKSDIFNIAIYGRHSLGAAYLSGLLGYSWQDTTTDRTVTISGVDRLHASFKAQALSARLEGGWRYTTPLIGIAPYAAVQSTTFFMPSYGESVTSGSSAFALSYAAKTTTATRAELGARFDKAMLVPGGIFTLKAKTAWAHDWNTDRDATATFQSLPGATFTTSGAQPSPNAALLSLGGEMAFHNGWSVAANFDGEFSRTTGYSGKATVRYGW